MYKRDYTIIISADDNDDVYWQMLRKGEPAACNEEEEKLAEEMIGAVMHKLEVHAFWRQSKREESYKEVPSIVKWAYEKD
jgi:hypothetical protein